MVFLQKYLLVVLFSSSAFSFSQNLIPNSSFEQFNACPDTNFGLISSVDYWYNPGGFTPDYLNACDTNVTWPNHGVPLNQYGFQYGKTSVAYAGIILSYLYPPKDSVREYIGVKLLDTLKAGKSYAVSFYVSLADSSFYSANDIGIYFSNTLISSASPYPLPYNPQIKNNPLNNPLINKTGWIEVRDTFIAQGGEQYIILGNFKNDANTDTTNLNDIQPGTGTPFSYYYIDDVSIICLDCLLNITDISHSSNIKVFPNPCSDFIYIQCNETITYLEIHNCFGQKIYSSQISNLKSQIFVDLSQQKAGIYFLTIHTSSGNQTEKLILTSKNN